jgi:cell wall-associated NlpC family hydrolase
LSATVLFIEIPTAPGWAEPAAPAIAGIAAGDGLAAVRADVADARAKLDDLVAHTDAATEPFHAERIKLAAAARSTAAEKGRLTRESALAGRPGAAFAGPSPARVGAPLSPAVFTGGSGAPVAVREAYAQLGKPYEWGAAGPDSFDCSGLTLLVWAKAGIALSHSSSVQWNEGRRVSRAELVPGDLVFFHADLHHVGIYVGDGNMIDAPRTGEVVRVEGVWWSSFQGGVRPGPAEWGGDQVST